MSTTPDPSPIERPHYDRIGRTYTATRQADPRVAAPILAALGDAATVLNVGAGTGNYEPADRTVVALEPSRTMIAQRTPGTGTAVQGAAEHLPFADRTFDAAMGTLTLHHWTDLGAGLAELRRVADRQVLFLFDRDVSHRFWLITEYFPLLTELASEAEAPTASELARHLDIERVDTVPVPADCTDGFGGAYWNRPERYLDDDVLAGMSFTAVLGPDRLRAGLDHLAADLADGTWDRNHGPLRTLPEIDLGYRLVVARS